MYDRNDLVLAFDVVPGGGSSYSSLTHRFVHGAAVDQVFADEDALGEILWYLGDNQNTVRDVVDYDATLDETTIVNHLTYSAFGEITSQSDPTKQPLLAWTGRYRDSDTGLQWNLHRWYDPAVGRWLSEDPIGFAAGDTNLSRYVGNSPVNFIDPTGLEDLATSLGGEVTWIIEKPGFWPLADPDVRPVPIGNFDRNDHGVVILKPEFGSGHILMEDLQAIIASYWKDGPYLAGLSVTMQNLYIKLALDRERYFIEEELVESSPYVSGARLGDMQLNHFGMPQTEACAAAAGLIALMMKDVLKELAIQFGGGPAVKVFAKGGKIVVKGVVKGVETTYTFSQAQIRRLAKQAGHNAKRFDLDKIAHELDDYLKAPEHHIGTNKNWVSKLRGGPWSPKFEPLFQKAGMTLEGAANKVRIPGHYGPHPEAYHQAIFDRLNAATVDLYGNAYFDCLTYSR